VTASVLGGVGRASLVATSVVSSWLVPALLFIVVIVACWLGLRWIRSEHLDELAAAPLFSGLTRKRLMAILGSAHEVDFPPGGQIVEEGSRAGGFFVITEGEATVSAGGTELARLGPGSYFGEVAAIDGGPRSATIKAATRVNTLEVPPSALKALLRKEPSIEEAIAAELRRRLGDQGKADGDATLEELCRQLREAQQPDWAQTSSVPRRGLRRLLAR
jgi:CRP/FNR family transcriptional regulator, cyclic AMP receptor protein